MNAAVSDTDCSQDERLAPKPDDRDGDGLSDFDEEVGWQIVVDEVGLGPLGSHLTVKRVTSDADCSDTDGDGLDDLTEFLMRCDPRDEDSDKDGLTDYEELHRWKTNPTSVDTDGDARGPKGDLPPNADLFDGNEVDGPGTSPTLADSDGDGKTDFEELDAPVRSPLIAEIPRAEVFMEGDIDIRLRVEYEEAIGEESEYGKAFSTTKTTTSSRMDSRSVAETMAGSGGPLDRIDGKLLEFGCDVVGEYGSPVFDRVTGGLKGYGQGLRRLTGLFDDIADTVKGIGGDLVGSACEDATPDVTTTVTSSLTETSSRAATETFSEYLRDSRTRTERSASGSVKVAMRVRNTGVSTFNLSNLFVAMLQWQHESTAGAGTGSGAFRLLATLTPKIGDLVLAPGELSPPFEVSAENVDPTIVKQFLARPSAIFYAPAGFELENDAGINFEFLTEQTFSRTATIVIDYGEGAVERYQIATNVDRDDAGELAGVTMASVLDTCRVPYEVEADAGGFLRLKGFRGLDTFAPANPFDPDTGAAGDPGAVWVTYYGTQEQADPAQDFADIVVRAGDQIRFLYLRDADGDGLTDREEGVFGCRDSDEDERDNATGAPGADGRPDSIDTDSDGLTDYQEAKLGWTVTILAKPDPNGEVEEYSYRVVSSPVETDADRDGWTDAEERAAGTDPNNPDTDDDTIRDDIDPKPLTPARRLYVDAAVVGSGTGFSWGEAEQTLQEALEIARINNGNADVHDDVAEIWIASGVYTPGTETSDTFALVDKVSIFGGFAGFETRRGQRNPDPFTNGTVLSGDLARNDDPGERDPSDASRADNATTVVTAAGTSAGTLVDGLTIANGNAPLNGSSPEARGAGLHVAAQAGGEFRRILFAFNSARDSGGGVFLAFSDPPSTTPVRLVGCAFVSNFSGVSGGGLHAASGSLAVIEDCLFEDNLTQRWGGGADVTDVTVRRCVFRGNVADDNGGGLRTIATGKGTMTLADCVFEGNTARDGGGLLAGSATPTELVNCVFRKNTATTGNGGGIWTTAIVLSHCTVVDNHAGAQGGGLYVPSRAVPAPLASSPNLQTRFSYNVSLRSSIFYFNTTNSNANPFGPDHFNVRIVEGVPVSYCCIENLNGVYAARTSNIDLDPGLADLGAGDVRLAAGSPCIDGVKAPAISLPATDLAGNPRLVDGDRDGITLVDIGAYEYNGG